MITSKDIDKSFDSLIDKATKVQVKFQLAEQFEKNLKAFKQFSPSIYEQYKNYQPQKFALGIDDEGGLNLFEKATGNSVYPENAKSFCQKQVKAYIKNPINCKNILNPKYTVPFFHQDHIEKFYETICENSFDFNGDINKTIGFFYINSIGVGYHLEELVEKLDIKHFFIFEPEKDLFYASLLTIDWLSILNKYTQKGYSLNIFIEKSKEHCMHSLNTLVSVYGLHSTANSFLYLHLDSEENTNFYQFFKENYSYLFTGVGYIEDEQVGLAHTLTNIKSTPIYHKQEGLKNLPPALIIGNGASLDEKIDFIKEIQDKVIIFCCGSTLSTLVDVGITPDFHVEMERTYDVYKSITSYANEDFLKKITLLGLNTLSPAVVNSFKDSYLFLKQNDTGSQYIKEHDIRTEKSTLYNCNPTVTNCGVAIAKELGFKNLILCGVDLGVISEHKHHSKHSAYYDTKNPEFNKIKEDEFPLNSKGNFTKSIKTSIVLNASRHNMERVISDNPELVIFNMSNGAFIKGSLPSTEKNININDFTHTNQHEKEELVNLMKMHFFKKIDLANGFSNQEIYENLINKAIAILDDINTDALDKENALNFFDDIHYYINQTDTSFSKMISGSMNQISFIAYKEIIASETIDITKLKNWLSDYIHQSIEYLKNHGLALDDRHG